MLGSPCWTALIMRTNAIAYGIAAIVVLVHHAPMSFYAFYVAGVIGFAVATGVA
jgi:hypothetical protein